MTESETAVQNNGETLYPMRLQKFLARAGVASRRGAENLMTQGRVRVNGQVVTELGSKVDPTIDRVEVDGVRVTYGEGNAYLVLNKPENVITTMDDPQGRPTVVPYIPLDRFPGLFPVGRLDRDTTGVLLFMTDGDLGARLLHPSSHVSKTYHAVVRGLVREEELDRLRQGITLEDGPCVPASCRIIDADEGYDVTLGRLRDNESCVEITITEGRKREVKRMMRAIHHPVLELNRVSFGPITARGLDVGAWRLLTSDEVGKLRALVANTPVPASHKRTVIAIDGPAGSGKSTIARLIARKLGFVYLDTGAMYRAVALSALEAGTPLDDAQALEEIARSCRISFEAQSDTSQRVLLNDEDITERIRTPQVDENVSRVARIPEVRAIMVDAQRALAGNADIVCEGRDMGTVVFPQAQVKVFLTATPQARAKRRAAQNREHGMSGEAIDEQAIRTSIEERDRIDSTRTLSPLRPADDAVIIDTSDMSIIDVVERIMTLANDVSQHERLPQ